MGVGLRRTDDFDEDGEDSDGDFEDEFEQALGECQMHSDGQCGAAGSEYCDWECPVMKMGGFEHEDSAADAG